MKNIAINKFLILLLQETEQPHRQPYSLTTAMVQKLKGAKTSDELQRYSSIHFENEGEEVLVSCKTCREAFALRGCEDKSVNTAV